MNRNHRYCHAWMRPTLAALLFVGCDRTTQGPVAEPGPAPTAPALRGAAAGHNLLLLTLDTTRADRLGCYGNAGARTPVLNTLAAEGVLCERALSVAPITLPAHTSILSGREPLDHGVHDNGLFRVPAETPLLAEALKKEGYTTAAFVSSFVLDGSYGLAQGFDVYDDRMDHDGGRGDGSEAERRAGNTVTAALNWLQEAPAEPWFLWVHLFDPHQPYEPPPPFDAMGLHPHDAEVAFMDAQIGRLLQAVDSDGRRERTLVAAVGDHGDGLEEHGESSHGLFVYDSTMVVPMLLRHPALPVGRRLAGQVVVTDLTPTLLDLLGVEDGVVRTGRSFLAALDQEDGEVWHDAYLENLMGFYSWGLAPLEAISDRTHKFIEAPRPELYDWRQDPGERRNLVDQQPDKVAELRERLFQHRAGRSALEQTPVRTLTEEERIRLEALGYVHGEVLADDTLDPKDYVVLIQRRLEASQALEAGQFARAETLLKEILARCPRDAVAMAGLGEIYVSTSRLDQGITWLERSLELRPDEWYFAQFLGDVCLRHERWKKALESFELALVHVPSSRPLRLKAARAALGLGALRKAGKHLESVAVEGLSVELQEVRQELQEELDRRRAAKDR